MAVSGFLVENISTLYTLEGVAAKSGRRLHAEDLSAIQDAAMVVQSGKIKWVGSRAELPSKYSRFKKINAQGGTIIPGFVDSHTHLVFAGDRSGDFEKRLQGQTYEQIGAAGGGILNTMRATREASTADLLKLCIPRVKNAIAQGITTMEIKTGYGLDFASEKKCLQVVGQLKKKTSVKILCTFLAAHAVPPEFKNKKSEYVKKIAEDWLPQVYKNIDFMDVFLDRGYFDVEDASTLILAAQKRGIPSRLHADELALSGGAETAVKYSAFSADHLLKISDKEVNMLARSETTATLLPTTAFFLNTEYAPARKLLDAGARVALASDFNPGTSPTQDISLVALLAALKMKMEPHEILAALTFNGACALGLQKKKGALLPGYDADFLILDSKTSFTSFFYQFGYRTLQLKTFILGKRQI